MAMIIVTPAMETDVDHLLDAGLVRFDEDGALIPCEPAGPPAFIVTARKVIGPFRNDAECRDFALNKFGINLPCYGAHLAHRVPANPGLVLSPERAEHMVLVSVKA